MDQSVVATAAAISKNIFMEAIKAQTRSEEAMEVDATDNSVSLGLLPIPCWAFEHFKKCLIDLKSAQAPFAHIHTQAKKVWEVFCQELQEETVKICKYLMIEKGPAVQSHNPGALTVWASPTTLQNRATLAPEDQEEPMEIEVEDVVGRYALVIFPGTFETLIEAGLSLIRVTAGIVTTQVSQVTGRDITIWNDY